MKTPSGVLKACFLDGNFYITLVHLIFYSFWANECNSQNVMTVLMSDREYEYELCEPFQTHFSSVSERFRSKLFNLSLFISRSQIGIYLVLSKWSRPLISTTTPIM